jgi:hypothetical protein
MRRATTPQALLIMRPFGAASTGAAQQSLTIRAAGPEVFIYESPEAQTCKLVAFDSEGSARLSVEVAKQDYSPRIAKWMQRSIAKFSLR